MLAEVLPKRPRNYHKDPFKWGSSAAEIALTVRLGRSGIMPPFEEALSEPEILAVAELVAGWAEDAERKREERPRG